MGDKGRLWTLTPGDHLVVHQDDNESAGGACQAKDREIFSRRAMPPLVYSFFWCLREQGVAVTVRKSAHYVWVHARPTRFSRTRPAKDGRQPREAGVLKLQPGEWVEVRSEPEIQKTLDETGRNYGLQFMPQMREACGKQFRVLKRAESIFFEESHQRRRITNTVLLEGSFCNGEGVGCDRCCFFFWREAWLKRSQSNGLGAA